MGTPPAPPWATCTYGNYERTLIPRWKSRVPFYRRFIDDVIGIWACDVCPERNNMLWTSFQLDMQQWYGMEWEFSPLSRTCNYMDLTLTITGRSIHSTLFEKPQNLYLDLPPHSSHPKGPLQSLIFGNILRIHRLCSTQHKVRKHTRAFHHRLTNRGYHTAVITPIFHKATKNAIAYTSRTAIEQATRQQMLTSKTDKTVFFHLQFHPQDPTARDLQQAWQQTVATPPNEAPLSQMKNMEGIHVPIHSLTIAYSHPPNLSNQFSIRKIESRGHTVSSYLT